MYDYKFAPTKVVNLIATKLLQDPNSIQSMLDQYAEGRTVTVGEDTYNVYVGRLRETLLDMGWEPPKKKDYSIEDLTL